MRRVYEYHPLVPCHPTAAPPPWTVADNGAAFIVKDRGGKTLAYGLLQEQGPGRRAAANLLTRDEALRIAANIAKLPGLLRKPQ